MKIMLPLLFLFCATPCMAQDSAITHLPGRYLTRTTHKAVALQNGLERKTTRLLSRWQKQEEKMQAKLRRIDPAAVFPTAQVGLPTPLQATGIDDTQQQTLAYLQKHKALLGKSASQLPAATAAYQSLAGKFKYADQVKEYIRLRRQVLQQTLSSYPGMVKDLKTLNQTAYQYGSELCAYKEMLKNPDKIEEKALVLLKKIPAYNDFISTHSQVASLFNLGTGFNSNRTTEGLQTRATVAQAVQQRLGTDASGIETATARRNAATQQIETLKKQFPQTDNAAEMPDYQPKEMKMQAFLKRLKPGGNIQFQRSGSYFPANVEIAGQLAYQFHKKGSLGVGLGYKLGLGENWDKIQFSHRGIGVRSFIDWKLKGTFFLNGGYELNRFTPFRNVQELRTRKGFVSSGLIGISQKYPIGPKLKANMMLLYDFLAERRQGQSDKFKLRIGYTL
ncbi:hypothetical protein [Chitinophaga sp. S165]|uniref:hypothetical protein n=1 Tax=Chitinophaga sp. S165 TaxID=2135462 RepID=UPI000D9D4C5B|nr:hypothetical protein [Chitinophaga sp. S165]PWV47661.1 hypothetical protein C7475_108228 [Chitinophaga sp. S165]